MSKYFERQLEELHFQLITLGSYCEKAISFSAKAIQKVQNEEIARQVFETDRDIDAKEREIENLCLSLLLHQNPVARDLREISAALKMVSDMERIGDQAADIAEIVKYMAEREIPNAQHLKNMSEFAMGMLSSSINAFVEQNADKARKVILDDDVVDSYFERVKADLIESLTQSEADKEAGQFLLDILMIAKYIERVGDHATNIAEWVVYGLTGAHPEETN